MHFSVKAQRLQHIGELECLLSQGGTRALWMGLTPTLIAAVPMVGIYMPLYDLLRDRFEPNLASAAPLAASSIARAIAVVCVAPLEVIRTQLMSGRSAASMNGMKACCKEPVPQPVRLSIISRPTGGAGWWRGLNATVRVLTRRRLNSHGRPMERADSRLSQFVAGATC
jgi:Mitochondrial carrier protein